MFKFIWPNKNVLGFEVNQLRDITATGDTARVTRLILLLVGIAFLVIKWSWTNLVLLLVALIVLSVIRWLIKRQTIKYTRLEIAEIWRSEERQKEIINALQDK